MDEKVMCLGYPESANLRRRITLLNETSKIFKEIRLYSERCRHIRNEVSNYDSQYKNQKGDTVIPETS